MEHLKTMQATRKKVTGSYENHDDPDDVVTALTYLDSWTDRGYVCETCHILVNVDGRFNFGRPDGEGKKYYLMVDRSEYTSDDLEELEKLLCEWLTEDGWFDEDEGWMCNHCSRHHTSDMTVGHEDEHGKTCPDCWRDIKFNSLETYAIVYIKVENPDPHQELLRHQSPAYDGIKKKLIAKLEPVLGEGNPDTWWIDDIHNEWLDGS